MAPLTRRRLLQGSAALLTGLAGCNRSSTSDSPRGTPRRGGNVERDPDRYVLRATDERPPAWLPNERRGNATTRDATASRPERARTYGLVASEETADRLRFADVEGADEARRFAFETDFDAETLYLDGHSVGACRRLELCYLTWSDTEIDTQYGGYYRDADVSCRTDDEHAVSWLVRIPDALDPDSVTRRGSGWSSSGCRPRPGRRDDDPGPGDDGTTTEEPHLGPATDTTRTTTATDTTRTTTAGESSGTATEDEP